MKLVLLAALSFCALLARADDPPAPQDMQRVGAGLEVGRQAVVVSDQGF